MAQQEHAPSQRVEKVKPVTEEKIPGTDVPDLTKAPVDDESQRRWMSRVAITTAVFATVASISSMYASNHLSQAMIEQIRASDQWNFYQAKGIKLAVLEARLETLAALRTPPADADAGPKATRYRGEQEEISAQAKAHQASCDDHRAHHTTFSRASTVLQIGIALTAVALLTRRNAFWILSIMVGVAGVAFVVQGLWPWK